MPRTRPAPKSTKNKRETKETPDTTTTTTTETKQETPETVVAVRETASDRMNKLCEEFDRLAGCVRVFKTELRNIKKLHERELREKEKGQRGGRRKRVQDPNRPKKAASGFAKAGPISTELKTFLGVPQDTELARTEVTKKITAYIKEHNLQDTGDRRIILPDTKLRKLLGVSKDEKVTFFNMQKYMKPHFPSSKK